MMCLQVFLECLLHALCECAPHAGTADGSIVVAWWCRFNRKGIGSRGALPVRAAFTSHANGIYRVHGARS
jgi:hypothetical protein